MALTDPIQGACGARRRMSPRALSVAVFSLFFSWLLAFPFEGQVLYKLAQSHALDADAYVFPTIAAQFAGLALCGFAVKNIRAAKRLMLASSAICILLSCAFFLPPSPLWLAALTLSSFVSGGCVAAWGFYFRSATAPNLRIKTAADGLIYSNILMILLNMAAIHISPSVGLALSMLALAASFILSLGLPEEKAAGIAKKKNPGVSVASPLALLCLFIVVITLNSGLMYQVLNPAYEQHRWLVSWYWAVPYILALFVMRNLPRRANRNYILYIAIAMIGFAFIFFMLLDRSAISYLIVNTLMLGACGVYDLFWWSILGEMLDDHHNPAKLLGVGLSANVLGVLIGGLIGRLLCVNESAGENSAPLALGVVCVTLILLPVLHKRLTAVLKNHAYLNQTPEGGPVDPAGIAKDLSLIGQLTMREREIAALLIRGKTYRMIAGELGLSENTIKTHVKNIYAKLHVQSRVELINTILAKQISEKSAE